MSPVAPQIKPHPPEKESMLIDRPIKIIRFQTPEVNKHRLPQRVTLTEGNFVAVERTISNDCLVFFERDCDFDNMFNITTLLQAAEYLERREREAEHGYASTAPMPEYVSKKKIKPKKSQGNRSTHNELEKNRRAHLRSSLEKLKELVPVGGDNSRHTTLGLLTNAKGFIRNLEDKERKYNQQKEHLKREHRFLQRRLESLMEGQYRVRQERSISECSTATSSTSSTSESDEIDILGYGSGQSDTDDHSSIESGSDGFTGAAKRLVLNSSSLDCL